METGRQSRLLMEATEERSSLSSPRHSSLHSSPPPGQTQSRDGKPVAGNLQVGFLQS